MKCGNCGFDFGGDRQMIILIPSQIVRCPKCGKLMWLGDGDDLDSLGTVCDAEEDDKDEPV